MYTPRNVLMVTWKTVAPKRRSSTKGVLVGFHVWKKSRHVCLFKMTPEPVMLREANPSDAGDPHPRSGVWCLFWTGCGGCFHTGRAWERRPPWQIRLHHSRKTRLILKRFPPNPWDSHHKTGTRNLQSPLPTPESWEEDSWFEC